MQENMVHETIRDVLRKADWAGVTVNRIDLMYPGQFDLMWSGGRVVIEGTEAVISFLEILAEQRRPLATR